MIEFNVDILILIFNELKENKNSLHSCLLVNRKWCCLIVPILWKNHAWNWYGSEKSKSRKKLFNIILSLLPSSSRQILSNNGIKLPAAATRLNPPLFNYINYCEFPESEIIEKIMKMVVGNPENNHKRNILEREIYKLFVSQSKNIRELLWDTTQPLSLFPGASTCFSQLYHLFIDINFVNPTALNEMANICRDLNELTIYNYSKDLPALISLIDVQRSLKSVKLFNLIKKGTCHELANALARKGNTINDLHLNSVSAIHPSLLKSLTKLRNLSINNNEKYEDSREETREFQQYLAISEFPNLQYLYVNELSCFRELAMLIERTKGNISQIEIYDANKVARGTGTFIRAIANNCPRLEVLCTYLVPKDFIHIKSLLMNCRSLTAIYFDSLNFFSNDNENIGDELLGILSEYSPKSLTKVELSGNWKISIEAFEQYFESRRERTLRCFNIIYHDGFCVTKDHNLIIEIIKKYINEGVINRSNFVKTVNS